MDKTPGLCSVVSAWKIISRMLFTRSKWRRELLHRVSCHGRRRMTLTYPTTNRSHFVLWLVTGDDKAGVLRRVCAGDAAIPTDQIRLGRSVVLADRLAATEFDGNSGAKELRQS
jgi:6-phosphogluconolactonase/glucosamine-6-phosphate isomerase/deaminase